MYTDRKKTVSPKGGQNSDFIIMNIRKVITTSMITLSSMGATAETPATPAIGRAEANVVKSVKMTPEVLWSMGRVSAAVASPDGKKIVYQVGYYSISQNKGQQRLYITDSEGGTPTLLTTGGKSETDATWIEGGRRIAYLSGGQIWSMNADGTERRQMTSDAKGIEAYRFSPDGKKVILVKSLEFNNIIQKNPDDLPLATGRVITDLMYRHWDHYVETIMHPFVADVTTQGIGEGKDIMEGEPYECPMEPFGGIEQLDWSKDSRYIAYTSRKCLGTEYATSTDSDIYLYDTETGKTRNLCKPEGYKAPESDPTLSKKHQAVNAEENLKNNVGYDQNPLFSQCGRYIAWLSMERDGYEADVNRLCIYDMATGEKRYLSHKSNVDEFCWGTKKDAAIYFTSVWHGCKNIYKADEKGCVTQVTDEQANYVSIAPLNDGKSLLVIKQSMSCPNDVYTVTPGKTMLKTVVKQVTAENKHILEQLHLGRVEARWVKTTDGKEMLVWVILPADFDVNKKYPAILYCQGGPQNAVSQFWSFRWNMQMMAANGYIVIAPNRRGLPGFGPEWNEEISGDWAGQCMKDYLSAIDNACETMPYVDREHLGAVGASFGGFSVYWLAGNHEKRFKCFIAHNGAFNLEAMYTDTEESWFTNWDYEGAYWNKNLSEKGKRTYENSPHKFVDRWDTPILCIHGELDYRISYNQGMGAFNAARMKGLPAEYLIFPDENHWVLKPQNGILWQRTFFSWLDKWLKTGNK